MDCIRIRNLRSIVDSGDIQLSKINILLGRNSSGKSSFLRLFPLLKETSRHELRGPILWFDENYDFGDFSNTLSRHAEGDKNTITFEFSWARSSRLRAGYYPFDDDLPKGDNIHAEIGISKHGDKTFIRKIRINIWNHDICFENDSPSKNVTLNLDGREVTQNTYRWKYGSTGILPMLSPQNDIIPIDIIIHSLNDLFKKEIRDNNVYFLWRNPILDDESAWNFVKNNFFNKQTLRLTKSIKESEGYRVVIDTLIWMSMSRLLVSIDSELSEYFNHTYYITPLRYNFVRYMRNRELAVEYVESTGKNVMEYILSLNETERNSYIDYIESTLGVKIDVTGQDNKSIYVTMSDGERDNIVDVGYGYSQVLPIATILWDRAYKRDRYAGNTIVIEQPEVHLHPAMQKRLARLFVEALNLAKTRGRKLTLIVETHSSALVNRLGRYVQNSTVPSIPELSKYYYLDDERDVKLSKDDISVYLFEKVVGVTHITKTEYDNSGRVAKWPIGFLD